MRENKTSESKLRANRKYLQKFDNILVRMSKEEKIAIKEYACEHNISVNTLIMSVIKQEIPDIDERIRKIIADNEE